MIYKGTHIAFPFQKPPTVKMEIQKSWYDTYSSSNKSICKNITLNMLDALTYVIFTHRHILDYFESSSILLK